MDSHEEQLIQDLILKGALEFAGIDPDTGEMLYNFSDKIKTVMPALYDQHLKNINEDVMYFWEHGYLDMDLFSDNPLILLTDKALDQNEVSKLSIEKQRSFQEIKRIVLS